jgi:hypothetical protein
MDQRQLLPLHRLPRHRRRRVCTVLDQQKAGRFADEPVDSADEVRA